MTAASGPGEPAAPGTAARPARIVEVKRRPGGVDERFDCELVHLTPWRVIVCYRVTQPPPGVRAAFGAPLDSYGFFWRRRPYICYQMVRPRDGAPAVTRFDVVRDVEVRGEVQAAREVRYTDLYLDLWVDEAGRARWEDGDEVEQAARAGLLDAADLARIDRTRGVLDRGHARVTAEVRRVLRTLGRLPS